MHTKKNFIAQILMQAVIGEEKQTSTTEINSQISKPDFLSFSIQ